MNLGEWLGILGGQAVISGIMATALYQRLRSKLKMQEGRIERLDRRQKQGKHQLDQRTRKLLSLAAQTRNTLSQIGLAIGELKASSKALEHIPANTQAASALALQEATLHGSDARRLRIVITTLPKVGSSAINAILRNALPAATVEQTHGVSLDGQAALAGDIQASPDGYTRDALINNFHLMIAMRTELDRLQNSTSPASGVYFICGTREPLSWALSLLFQLLGMGTLSIEKAPVAEAQRIIMDWFYGRPIWRWIPAPGEWIHREINGYLGVDTVNLGFDPARGYKVVESRRGRVLFLRHENFDRMPEALGELLTAPASLFKNVRANVTAEKEVGSLYREVAANLRFPRSFVDRVYSDPYVTTFYSPEERQRFATKWSLE